MKKKMTRGCGRTGNPTDDKRLWIRIWKGKSKEILVVGITKIVEANKNYTNFDLPTLL